MKTNDNRKPFLRWVGSKKQLINHLLPYCNIKFNKYIEPFAGSARLFFSLNANNSILSDINCEMMTAYKVIKNNPVGLYNRLVSLNTDKNTFYKIRALKIPLINSLDTAARFIYLNSLCYGGLYRINKNGDFNVPYSNQKTGDLPTKKIISNCSEKLQSGTLICDDFENVIHNNLEKGDLVYLDPPYVTTNNKIFTQYIPNSFIIKDINRLKNILNYINENDAYFILSYLDSKEAKSIASIWNYKKFDVNRNIAKSGHNRRTETELIITNIE